MLLLALVAVASRIPVASGTATPASRAQIAASLAARGVAWIWPVSNGPILAPSGAAAYGEAAVVVETLVVDARSVQRMPRTQPLVLPVSVRVLPVLHVEAGPDAPDTLSESQRGAIVDAFARHAADAASGAGVIQLDFEAPRRERSSYQALVGAIRTALPASLKLSVTALAHWCAQGDWLDTLPVDEVVPMLYRLGPQSPQWRRRWLRDDPTLARRCRGPALGFATNDPPPAALLARTARPYWFDESAWSNRSVPSPGLVP